MGNLRQPRHHIEERSHVPGLFLYPYNFSNIWMRINRRADFRLRHWIKLVEEENRSAGVLAPAPLGAQFVANFAACDQNALGVRDFSILHNLLEVPLREFVNRRARVRMPQHALRCEYNERLAPWTQHLPSQEMKVLCSRGRLADLHVVPRGKL